MFLRITGESRQGNHSKEQWSTKCYLACLKSSLSVHFPSCLVGWLTWVAAAFTSFLVLLETDFREGSDRLLSIEVSVPDGLIPDCFPGISVMIHEA